MAKNKIIEGIVTNVDFPNKCTLVDNENEYTFKGAILGQKVAIKRTRGKKAKMVEVLEKSELEETSNCIHSDRCGGCAYQTFSYKKELSYKEKLIRKLLEENDINFDGFQFVESPVYSGYRNKMEYTFGDECKDGPLALGLHRKNHFHDIVNTPQCNIVHEDFNIIREFTREYFDGVLEKYNRMRHTGVLRHFVIRRSSLGEILINLVTTHNDFDFSKYYEELLNLKVEGKIVGIVHTYNDSLSDAIVPEKVEVVYGRDFIYEELLGLKFKVSCFSFFQTNTDSAKVLYELGRDMISGLDNKVLLDLYSGTGTITQIFGQYADKALGIEIVKDAVDAAVENAKLNELSNVEFICDDVFNAVKNLEYNPDIIVLDPPRDGINPRAIKNIIDFNPDEFLYISCNPATFVRDLQAFLDRGYRIDNLKALDQFPRTNHCEMICHLIK